MTADAVWLHRIYTEHHAGVLAWLKTKTGSDWALAEDLAEDTFVRAWRGRGSFAGGNVGGWLQVIARNLLTDHVRSARVRWEVPVAEFLFEPDPVPDPLMVLVAREQRVEERAGMLAAVRAMPLGELKARVGEVCGPGQWRVFMHAWLTPDAA